MILLLLVPAAAMVMVGILLYGTFVFGPLILVFGLTDGQPPLWLLVPAGAWAFLTFLAYPILVMVDFMYARTPALQRRRERKLAEAKEQREREEIRQQYETDNTCSYHSRLHCRQCDVEEEYLNGKWRRAERAEPW